MVATLVQTKVLTVDFDGWLMLRGRAGKTRAAYAQDVRHFAKWFGEQNGEELTAELLNSFDCQTYRTWCLQVEQCSPATWNRRRIALRAYVSWAREVGRVQFDPMQDVAGAEAQELAPRWLDAQEFGRLMRSIETAVNGAGTEQRRTRAIRDGAMIILMAFAGLRVAEVAGLLVGDVEISERKGKVTVRLGKGEKHRVVPLGADARRWLASWMEVRPGGEALFVDEAGAGISPRAIEKRVAALGEAAKVTLSPHDLRHTCAKRMVDAGRALTEVAAILGHSKIETTARYAQPGWRDLEDAVETVSMGRQGRSK